MTAADLRALARESADMARMARFHQLVITAKEKNWLNVEAARVAHDLADGHITASLYLDAAACQLTGEAA